MAEPRTLVVTRAGRHSLHPEWVAGRDRQDFDLLVTRYEPGPPTPAGPGRAEIDLPGPKVAGYARLFRQRPDLLDRYDLIALVDDDIRTTAADLEQLFAIGDRHGLDLFQPSLAWDSHFTYAAFLHNPAFLLRYTNVVEMMCPVFRAAHLRRALPLFDESYETGIDLLWCRLSDRPRLRHGVIDAVQVTHTRPVGTTKDRQGFASDTYDRQIAAVLDRYQASFRGVVAYAGIDARAGRHRSRAAVALRSMTLWNGLRRTPMPRAHFVRFVADHIRHGLTRPLNLEPLDLRASPPTATEILP